MMNDAIKALNRNTIASQNGSAKDSSAMNHFCRLLFENSFGNVEAYRNRLEWITCYEELDPELREQVEVKKSQIDIELSQNMSYEEATRVR